MSRSDRLRHPCGADCQSAEVPSRGTDCQSALPRTRRRTRRHRLLRRATLLALGLVCVSGCGDGRPKRVPVSGQVLVDGKPLPYGFVQVVPEGARPAAGAVGPDGRFTLTTFEPGDGAVLGIHPVMVTAAEMISTTTQRWHAPKKYADVATSGLAVTIDAPTDSLLIQLSWDGGKPFDELVDR